MLITPRSYPPVPRAGKFVDRYTEINEYRLRQSEREEQARKERIQEERRQQKAFLDQQMKLQENGKGSEKEADAHYSKFEAERRGRWNEIDALKRQERKEAEVAQRLARDAQVREVAARKVAEKEEAARVDKEILARIRGELRDERIKARVRHLEEASNMRRVIAQNEANVRIAADMRHKAFLEGQKVGIEYKKILDKQEKDREDRLKQTYSRMAKQAVHANFLHNQIATEGAKDEARARERQEQDAKARDDELAARDAQRRALQQEVNEVLAVQVADRKKASAKFQREDAALVDLVARAAAESAAKEDEDKRKRREFNLTYRKELEEQIKANQVRQHAPHVRMFCCGP